MYKHMLIFGYIIFLYIMKIVTLFFCLNFIPIWSSFHPKSHPTKIDYVILSQPHNYFGEPQCLQNPLDLSILEFGHLNFIDVQKGTPKGVASCGTKPCSVDGHGQQMDLAHCNNPYTHQCGEEWEIYKHLFLPPQCYRFMHENYVLFISLL